MKLWGELQRKNSCQSSKDAHCVLGEQRRERQQFNYCTRKHQRLASCGRFGVLCVCVRSAKTLTLENTNLLITLPPPPTLPPSSPSAARERPRPHVAEEEPTTLAIVVITVDKQRDANCVSAKSRRQSCIHHRLQFANPTTTLEWKRSAALEGVNGGQRQKK